MKVKFALFICLTAATAVLAHDGVKDAQVMARMNLMTDIAKDMKVLGDMAKGETAFDADVVAMRAESLAAHSRGIITLFEIKATDPKSEARDEIWIDWSGFNSSAEEMEQAAIALGLVRNADAFEPAFATLGKTCTACHKTYRIEKN